MEDYFNKYLMAKLSLYKMVSQFLNSYLSLDEVKKRQLEIDEEYFIYGNYQEVCFHNFKSEGVLAWKYLDLKKDYITHREIWDLEFNLKNTKLDPNIDYYEEYLKISILLIDMTKKYYEYTITLEDAQKNNIKYNDIDELYNQICVCYNYSESAGESVWNLFNIDNDMIGTSIFEKIRTECVSELIKNKEKEKVKKINR